MSATAFVSEHVTVRRDSLNKIVIGTEEPLTDEQMKDLYWISYLMMKTGKCAKDIFSESSIVHCKKGC